MDLTAWARSVGLPETTAPDEARPLRRLREPFVVAAPAGVRTRTRIHLDDAEVVALREIGSFLGGLFRVELAGRVRAGRLDATSKADWRRTRKQALTAVSSSRWGGAITRAVEDQYQLGMRGLAAEAQMLRSAISTIEARCAAPVGGKAQRVKGYRSRSERFQKTRRLAVLRTRLTDCEYRMGVGRPRLVAGGGRLWRTRNNLDTAGTTETQWRTEWDARRWFLTADGESGKRYGNETIRVDTDGYLTIKVPAALADTYGTHLRVTTPVTFNTHRGNEWANRINANQSVRYDITYDPDKDRWYLDPSWAYPPAPSMSLDWLRGYRTLAIDLNADHLAAWVIDPDGNPVGTPITIDLNLTGLPATTRDAHLRHAITTVINYALDHECQSISIENLNFTDSRTTGRETMGRGGRGRTFRRAVAGIPTAKFRDRLAGMTATAGLALIAVDPAYTSKWGDQHWRKPLQHQTPDTTVTRHHAAAVAIGRRAHGHRIRRKPAGPRPGQRTRPGQPTASHPTPLRTPAPTTNRRRRTPTRCPGHAGP